MADLKISQLTGATTPLAGTEVLPVVQSGSTKKVSVANLTAGRQIAAAGVNTSDNVVIGTSGKGIDFSATSHHPNMTSELFNDYEEGYWDPTLTTDGTNFTSVSYAAQNLAQYVKIGRVVFVHGVLYTDSVTVGSASGSVMLGNLPFPNSSLTPAGRTASAGSIGTTLGWVTNAPMALATEYAGSRLYLRRFDTSGVFTDIGVANVSTTTNLISFAITYETD